MISCLKSRPPYQDELVLVREDKDQLWYPSFADFEKDYPNLIREAQFLFTDTLLAGYFAQLDGDHTINIQEDELSMGVWMHRQDVPPDTQKISLTGEMMEAFRTGKIC